MSPPPPHSHPEEPPHFVAFRQGSMGEEEPWGSSLCLARRPGVCHEMGKAQGRQCISSFSQHPRDPKASAARISLWKEPEDRQLQKEEEKQRCLAQGAARCAGHTKG